MGDVGCRRESPQECAPFWESFADRSTKFVIMSEHSPSQQASTIRYRLKYRLISNVNFDKVKRNPYATPPFPNCGVGFQR